MSIGEDKVVGKLVKLDIYGNSNGKIDVFGGNIVRVPSDYLSILVSSLDNFLNQIATYEDQDKKPSVYILDEIGFKTAFFFLADVMRSETWKTEIEPMINNKEDWIMGAVSVINSMGFGKWQVREFEPDKKMVINLFDSFEVEYYHINNIIDKVKYPVCHIASGISKSLMALVYDAGIFEDDSIDINIDLFNEIKNKENAFVSEEVKCKALSKDFCEFIVERK